MSNAPEPDYDPQGPAYCVDAVSVATVLLPDGWHEVLPGTFAVAPVRLATFDPDGNTNDPPRTVHAFAAITFVEYSTGAPVVAPIESLRAVTLNEGADYVSLPFALEWTTEPVYAADADADDYPNRTNPKGNP